MPVNKSGTPTSGVNAAETANTFTPETAEPDVPDINVSENVENVKSLKAPLKGELSAELTEGSLC